MRARSRAGLLRRLALGPVVLPDRVSATSVTRSRRPAPRVRFGPMTVGAGADGVDPTQAPAGADGAIRPVPSAAWAARSARPTSTPAAV